MIKISGVYAELFLKKTVPHIILCWGLFSLLAGRAKIGWHSDTVICCYGNLLSISYVIDICNFVRLDTGVLVIFEYFGATVALEIFRKLLQNYLK